MIVVAPELAETLVTWSDWRFTSLQIPMGPCMRARGCLSLSKGSWKRNFCLRKPYMITLPCTAELRHAPLSWVSHTCMLLSNTSHYIHTNVLGRFWQAASSRYHPAPPLSYSTLCNWEIWHIYPIPQAVSMLFHCTLETKLLFLPTNHFQTNGGVCGSLDFFLSLFLSLFLSFFHFLFFLYFTFSFSFFSFFLSLSKCSVFPHVTVCKHFISKYWRVAGGEISYLKLIKQFGTEATAITSKWIWVFWSMVSSRDNIQRTACSEGGREVALAHAVTFLPAPLPMFLGPCPNERSYAPWLYSASLCHCANSMFGAIT